LGCRRNDESEGFLQAWVSAADSDAADNEHKPNTDIEARLLRDALVIFGGQHNFKPGIIVRDNAQLFARAKMAPGVTTLASTGMLKPRTTEKCAIFPPIAGNRIGRAVWS
jgi:hypothetical protein